MLLFILYFVDVVILKKIFLFGGVLPSLDKILSLVEVLRLIFYVLMMFICVLFAHSNSPWKFFIYFFFFNFTDLFISIYCF